MDNINYIDDKVKINKLFSLITKHYFTPGGNYVETSFILDAGYFTTDDFPFCYAILNELGYEVNDKIMYIHTMQYVFRETLEKIVAAVKTSTPKSGNEEHESLYE